MMAKKTTTTTANSESIGAILKARREETGTSQRDIANILGYKNANFISMIEAGRSNPPLGRIANIISAYGLPHEFMCVMVKALYPEAWITFSKILHSDAGSKICKGTEPEVEELVDVNFTSLAKKYKIS